MAEGFLRKFIGQKARLYQASSAGISAPEGFSATTETVKLMKAKGVDVSDHHSQRLTTQQIRQAYRIFAMERVHRDWIVNLVPESKDKVFLLTDFAIDKTQGALGVPDPIWMSESFYVNVLDVIENCVSTIVKELPDHE